jgi:hypothetical protein
MQAAKTALRTVTAGRPEPAGVDHARRPNQGRIMIFGLSTLGFVHTALSLVALASGLIVVGGLVAGRRFDGWTAVYFATAVATDATGFALPRNFDIVHWLGLAMAASLVIAVLARYLFRLAGPWRPIFAAATVVSVYVLVFFTIGEAFLRIPALHALAPNLTEMPFALAQLVGMVVFGGLAVAAAVKFRAEAVS